MSLNRTIDHLRLSASMAAKGRPRLALADQALWRAAAPQPMTGCHHPMMIMTLAYSLLYMPDSAIYAWMLNRS